MDIMTHLFHLPKDVLLMILFWAEPGSVLSFFSLCKRTRSWDNDRFWESYYRFLIPSKFDLGLDRRERVEKNGFFSTEKSSKTIDSWKLRFRLNYSYGLTVSTKTEDLFWNFEFHNVYINLSQCKDFFVLYPILLSEMFFNSKKRLYSDSLWMEKTIDIRVFPFHHRILLKVRDYPRLKGHGNMRKKMLDNGSIQTAFLGLHVKEDLIVTPRPDHSMILVKF